MIRNFLILLLIGLPNFLPAQEIIEAEFKDRNALVHSIEQERKNSSDLINRLDDLISKSSQSTNTKFFLQLAKDELLQTGQLTFQASFDRIEKKRNLDPSFKQGLLHLESYYLKSNRNLHHLELLAQHSEPGVTPDLEDDPVIRQELPFYSVQSNMHIAEIGAGGTQFIKHWLPMLKNAHIYLNDIDATTVQEMANEIGLGNAFKQQRQQIHAVLGNHWSSGLEGEQLDIILIRNALHHFAAPNEMLQSIKKSLKSSGTLYIKETFKENCTENCCPDLGNQADILKQILQNGFQLKRSEIIYEGSTAWQLWAFELITG